MPEIYNPETNTTNLQEKTPNYLIEAQWTGQQIREAEEKLIAIKIRNKLQVELEAYAATKYYVIHKVENENRMRILQAITEEEMQLIKLTAIEYEEFDEGWEEAISIIVKHAKNHKD